MRDNPVKKSLHGGGTAAGAMVFELFAPGLPQICRDAGADFLLYDMEHTGLGFETLKTQLAVCRGLGIVPMARVPRGEYHFIARALGVAAKMAALHKRTLVIAQIETAEGVANVEAIAAVPGVDALWIGQFDLSNFLGIPGEFRHPAYLDAVDRVVRACAAYGIDQLLLQSALRYGLDVLRGALATKGKRP